MHVAAVALCYLRVFNRNMHNGCVLCNLTLTAFVSVIVSHVVVGCQAVVWSDRAGVKLSHLQKVADAPLAFWAKVDPRQQGQADEILNRPQDNVTDTVLCLFCIMFLVDEITFLCLHCANSI